jgi:lysophospholipase L1-like esterase
MRLRSRKYPLLCVRVAGAIAVAAVATLAGPTTASPIRKHVWRIYPLGDSITFGATGVSARHHAVNKTPGGYRQPLDGLLTKAGMWHQFVGTLRVNSTPLLTERGQEWHDGHGGYRIDQITADLAGVAGGNSDDGGHWLTGISGVRAPINPEIVIIHLGTNDIHQRWDPSHRYPTRDGKANLFNRAQRARFVKDMTARLGTLVSTIYKFRPGIRIVLSDIIPIGRVLSDPVTPEYANAIRGLAVHEQDLGRRVVFADVWNAFVVRSHGVDTIIPGLKGPDLYHPAPAGYQVMARVYSNAVQRLV